MVDWGQMIRMTFMRRLVGLGVFLAVAGVAWGQLVPAGMRALADEEGAVPGVAYEFPVLEGGEVLSLIHI